MNNLTKIKALHEHAGMSLQDASAFVKAANTKAEQPTLRDQFAMAALTGMIASNAHPHSQGYGLEANEYIPVEAYKYADVMLKMRDKEAKK